MVNQTKRYELRLYDRTLLVFSAMADTFGNVSLSVLDGDEDARGLFPLPLTRDLGRNSLKEWLDTRVVPKNRRFVDKILAQAGLTPGDTMGIIDVCLGLSINDAYWVVPEGFAGTFADYNLFDNELDEALALTAYTGYTSTQHRRAVLSTEWTTDGQYPKAWRRVDNALLLFKAGTEGYANSGMGPYSEFFAAQAAEAFGIPHVDYDLEKWQGKLASVCPLMHGKDTAFVPFWPATGQSRFPANLAAAERVSPEAFESLRDMLVFDALVCNVDRHANNYGFLRDNHTGKMLSFAPLFDHNLALFPGDMASDFDDWPRKAGSQTPAGSNLPFDQALQVIMAERHREALRRMLSFELTNHPVCPVDEERLDALNRYLGERARQMLAIEPTSSADVLARIEGTLPEDAFVPAAAVGV